MSFGKMRLLLLLAPAFVLGCSIHRDVMPEAEELEVLVQQHRFKRDTEYLCQPGDTPPPNRVDTSARLAELRAEMARLGLAAYIVPLDDEGRRTWISGFSGSNGDSVVTMDQAATWTDGRYFLQAAEELDCNWQLMKMGQSTTPGYGGWLVGDANLPPGGIVGADPTLVSAQSWLDLRDQLAESGLILESISDNLIDNIWTTADGRPPFQPRDIVPHPVVYAGQSHADKLVELRAKLMDNRFDAMVVSEQDELAWLFNLRGEGSSSNSGLMSSPLFEALALVSQNEILLWLHLSKLTSEVSDHLNVSCADEGICITIFDLAYAYDGLTSWAESQINTPKILVTTPTTYLTGASYAIYESLPEEASQFEVSPIILMKGTKNPVEVQGMIDSHIRDAYACIEFFAFMEDQISNQGSQEWDEISASAKLLELRQAQPLFKGQSFTTIAASGSNGAVIHYTPDPTTVAKINDSAVFLVDSGGQYQDGGTTDITRTFHYGIPDPEVIDRYTKVLMGAIDLARVVIPDGTNDRGIDVLTRQHLFKEGLDYRHGTGHGIGSYLKVHEGPVRIAMSGNPGQLRANQFFSDEPGFYKDGHYGIRLETIIRVVNKSVPNTEYGNFIGFEPVTLVPFEPKLIDFSQMHPDQIEWYNYYSQQIRSTIVPHFQDLGRTDVVDWIYSKTEQVDPRVSHIIQRYID